MRPMKHILTFLAASLLLVLLLNSRARASSSGISSSRPLVEENKPAAERSTYAYGQPEALGVGYSRNRQADLKQTTAQKGR